MNKNTLEIVKKIKRIAEKSNGFARFLTDVNITSASTGHLLAEVKIAEKHLSFDGCIHGAFLSFLVDNITSINGTSLFSTFGPSINIQVSFLNTKVKVGDLVTIEAKVLSSPQSPILFHECVFTNKLTNTLIATGTHSTFLGEPSRTVNVLNLPKKTL